VLLVLALLGCGGGAGGTGDAGAGPDAPSQLCIAPPGDTWVVTSLSILGEGEGFDLDGDGEIDNEFGKTPEGARAEIAAGLNTSLEAHEMTVLIHITGWDPPGAARAPTVAFYMGTDPTGLYESGDYHVWSDQFDLDCNPRNETDDVEIDGRAVTARRDIWNFPLSTATGSVVMVDPLLQLEFDEAYQRVNGTMGMTVTMCSLSAIPFPGLQAGSTLDVVVNEPSLEVISVDMDLDGDGLEQARGDGVTIRDCVDGDGITIIDGRSCPCHPAIADGYSFAFGLEATRARIVGTAE
jgi:hypothetical protein